MAIKRFHFISGILISIFIILHLFNHLSSVFGHGKHIELMNTLRQFYRNPYIEAVLMASILAQIISGIKLFRTARKTATSGFSKLHIWTGLYLAFFLTFHVSAVFAGRLLLNLDTNFYFGAAGLNTFPFNLFFIPYYGLAIFSVFGHLASVHRKQMKQTVFGLTPVRQASGILIIGVVLTIIIFYGMTNRLNGVDIPQEYNILIGK